MNHFKIPFLWPFKMVKNNGGIHFDDQWACLQIREHQIKAIYKQKWIKSVTTKLQVESSAMPDNLLLKNKYFGTVKQFVWTAVVTATGYAIYETTFDISDVDDDTYFLYQKSPVLGEEAVSEPILSASSHINVLKFRYKNSFNKDDVAWTTGLIMTFMCEADIQEFEPELEEVDFVNQVNDTVNLDATASRMFQLYIGDTKNGTSGVAPYVVDILNRIFACDWIEIQGMQYNNKTGSKFKTTRNRNYSLIGASIDLVPRFNLASLEFVDTTPLPVGFIAAYNIETGFFGPGSVLPIIEVEENG